MAAGPTSRFDLRNALLADLASGVIQTQTGVAFFAEANVLAVKAASGHWKLRQSGNAALIAPGRYRLCFGIELNPAYVDVAIERWQQLTGTNVVLADTGETFADLKAKRLAA